MTINDPDINTNPDNQGTPLEGGSSDGFPAPEPLKVPLGEFKKRRSQIQMRIKVLETYVVEAISQNGNPYDQLVVEYLLLSTMEKREKRTAAYTEEAEMILEADLHRYAEKVHRWLVAMG